jgi:hypothetical protein
VHVVGFACAVSLLALGCAGRSESTPADPPAGPSRSEPLRLARQLSRAEPGLSRALEHATLEPAGAAARSRSGATDPFLRLPATADGVVDLRSGERAAPLAQLRSLHATGAPLELIEGVALYRGAVAGADSLWLPHANAVEQLLLAREAAPRVELAWQLCRAPFLDAGRSSPELGLIFADRHGTDRLRIPPAFALDAAGKRRELSMQFTPESATCGRVDFRLETRGLSWPLLIDPALEAVVWTDRTDPDHKPTARFWHALAYDPLREKSLMFGGSDNSGGPFLGDTWEWDGAAWHELTDTAGPEGRLLHDLAYSSVHSGVLLIGGTASEPEVAFNDVWLWNGSWSQLEPGGAELPVLAGHSIAFDSARKVMVLYGGYGLDENRELWELGADGWTNRGEFSLSPGSLDLFSMAYDEAHAYSLVFAGSSPAGVGYQEPIAVTDAAYFWNGKGWTHLDVERPSARSGMASAYDSKRQRIVLFGGTPDTLGDQFSAETWEFSDGSFEQRSPLRSPPARESARLTYDAARDRMLLFGGFGLSDGDDTWTYAHFGNTCQNEADCDGEACVDGVCCQDKLCGTCEACSELTGTCQPLRSTDDPNGDCAGDHSCSESGACLPSIGRDCSEDAECASGHCADGVCCDQACDGACQACTLAGHEGTCTFVKGEAAHGSCPGRGDCASSCDGEQADCSPVPEGRDCGTSCADAVLTVKACDADGRCRSRTPRECPDHLLCEDDVGCLSICSQASDCAEGFVCQNRACVEETARCADETTVEGPAGRQDCGAYVCSGGKCKTRCQRAADCALDRVCNDRGQCISPEAAAAGDAPGDDGCGCRSAGAPVGAAAPWLLGLAALLLLERRRAA